MRDPAELLPLPLQRLTTRAVAALPRGVVSALAGRPTVVDGLTLHPEMALVLRLQRLAGEQGWEVMGVQGTRRHVAQQSKAAAVRLAPVESVRSLVIEGDAGPLPARLYVPRSAPASAGLLVFFHGGGHVFGDLESHDATCRLLCSRAAVLVLSVEYRLAPEHPFPAAVDDALASFRWAVAHAAELGADPTRIAVGGDSAGGNLAAVAALGARDAGDAVRPAFQLLIYPVVDMTARTPSRSLFGEGFYLTTPGIAFTRGHYVPDEAQRRDPRASPLLADRHDDLPPAHVVTAGFDPLRDEGEAYAAALRAAGVSVTVRREPGLIHGFANMIGVSDAARDATGVLADALARALR